MIEINNLSVTFDKNEILHNLSLEIDTNRILAIVGQSGCGKSTFLKCLNRIVEEEGGNVSGQIRYNGEDIYKIHKENLRKRVGMVFQQPIAFPCTVEKNLLYVLDYHKKLSKVQKSQVVQDVLKKANLYEEIKDKMHLNAEKLSGGQKQRLAIARALLPGPEIILLDEPCSALDLKNTIAIEEMLLELKKDYGIIIVTHNM